MYKRDTSTGVGRYIWPGLVLSGIMVCVHSVHTWLAWKHYMLGIQPRTFIGLSGVAVSPFIHASWSHLLSNVFPLVLLSFVLFATMRPIALNVIIWIWVLSGFWTWCLARPSYHIGASGIVYGLAAFLFFTGWFSPNKRAMALTAFVAIFYHQLIYGLFPTDEGISWEAHLAGTLAGITSCYVFISKLRKLFPKPAALSEPEASYPYWLYDSAHYVDQQGRVINPNEFASNPEHSPTLLSGSSGQTPTDAPKSLPSDHTQVQIKYHYVPNK